MEEPAAILQAIEDVLCPKQDFMGRRLLVTAGPTREMLDPVRFLTNRSTGRMGFAIAEAARDRGATVTLVSGPVSLPAPAGVEFVPIVSCAELCEAVLSRAEDSDVVIQAAAPADFRPRAVAAEKIKKSGEGMTLELENTTDIAAELGSRKGGRVLVGFALETDDEEAHAREKLRRKHFDFVVLNSLRDAGAGFRGDTNKVTFVSEAGNEPLPLLAKREVAARIADKIETLINE